MSYAPQVVADGSDWSGNGLRFATEAEAQEWVRGLSVRWTLVRDTRVVESSDPVNHRLVDGQVVAVGEGS